jgi:LysM repeat protein
MNNNNNNNLNADQRSPDNTQNKEKISPLAAGVAAAAAGAVGFAGGVHYERLESEQSQEVTAEKTMSEDSFNEHAETVEAGSESESVESPSAEEIPIESNSESSDVIHSHTAAQDASNIVDADVISSELSYSFSSDNGVFEVSWEDINHDGNPDLVDFISMDQAGNMASFSASGEMLDALATGANDGVDDYESGVTFDNATEDESMSDLSVNETSNGISDFDNFNVYEVQPGDTLSEIAFEHGTSIDHIMAENPQIDDPNLIYTGEEILVPTQDDEASPYAHWEPESAGGFAAGEDGIDPSSLDVYGGANDSFGFSDIASDEVYDYSMEGDSYYEMDSVEAAAGVDGYYSETGADSNNYQTEYESTDFETYGEYESSEGENSFEDYNTDSYDSSEAPFDAC